MPKAITFVGCNIILGAGQEEYIPLPAMLEEDHDQRPMTFCWEFSEEEMTELIRTRRLWHTVWTFGHKFQPVLLQAFKPDHV